MITSSSISPDSAAGLSGTIDTTSAPFLLSRSSAFEISSDIFWICTPSHPLETVPSSIKSSTTLRA